MEFNNYIKKMLDKTNLTKDEKKEMKIELLEHLNSMKDDFLSENHSEKDAINLTLKNFNKENFLKEINELETSSLKGISSNFIIKNALLSGLIYCLLVIILVSFVSVYRESEIFYYLIIFVTLVFNFIMTTRKFNNKKDLRKNFIISGLSFIVLERLIIYLVSKSYSLINMLTSTNFDIYKVSFLEPIISTFILILITYLSIYYKGPSKKTINLNLSILEKLVLLFSLVLTVLYFLYPNRLYVLKTAISILFNFSIDIFTKNIFFITINNNFKIFNLGLIILILFIPYKLISNNLRKSALE